LTSTNPSVYKGPLNLRASGARNLSTGPKGLDKAISQEPPGMGSNGQVQTCKMQSAHAHIVDDM